MTTAFVLAEDHGKAAELATGARTLAAEVALIAIGAPPAGPLADRHLVITLPDGYLFEDAFDSIAALVAQEKPDFILVQPSRRVKVIAGRLAARLGASVITEVTALAPSGEATSMYFGGAGVRRQKPATAPAIYAVNAGAFEAAPSGAGAVTAVPWVEPAVRVTKTASTPLPKQDVDLTGAKRVVAIGRGLAKEDDLPLVRAFADALKAGLGCSRPIAETEGWLPRSQYIGVSGLTLKPDVYVAVGISGQMQHMVGVSRAKTIVAINKDKTAPVFKQADIGLVGDLYAVLPELTAALA